MRTDWAAIAGGSVPDLLPDYQPSVGAILGMLKAYAGNEIGDPEKIAQVIVDLANRDRVPAHLLIGSDALHVFKEAEEKRQREFADWIDVTTSTDFADSDLGFLAQLRQA